MKSKEEMLAYAAFLYSPVWRFRKGRTKKDSLIATLGMLHDGVEFEAIDIRRIASKRVDNIVDKISKMSIVEEDDSTMQQRIARADVFPRESETFEKLRSIFETKVDSPSSSKKKKSATTRCQENDDEQNRGTVKMRKPNKTEGWLKSNHGTEIRKSVIKTSAVFACANTFQDMLRKKKSRAKRRKLNAKGTMRLHLTQDEKSFLSFLRGISKESGQIRRDLGEAANLFVLETFGEDTVSRMSSTMVSHFLYSFLKLFHSLVFIEQAAGIVR